MLSAANLTTRALQLLGVLQAGETAGGDDTELGMETLNALLGSWNISPLLTYATTHILVPVAPGQTSVTIGPGQQVDTVRPVEIGGRAFLRSGNLDYPMVEVTQEQYDSITYKTLGSSFPGVYYFESSYPAATLYFWPSPAGNYTLHLPVRGLFTSFEDPQDEIGFPPGYERALAYSLAEELAPAFGRDLPPSVTRIAASARRVLKRQNAVAPVLDATQPRNSFNILSGDR